jgi:hypothetical protein
MGWPYVACSAAVLPLGQFFSKAPAGDISSKMDGLEARLKEVHRDLMGVCTSALDSVGAADSNQKLLVKLNGVIREAAAAEVACLELRDSLGNTLKNLDVSGGGDLVEGRKRQADSLSQKVAKCEEFLAQCRTIPPKLEDVKKTFGEAEVFRTALTDVFGKQSADAETRAALEKRLTELIGPLDASPNKGYLPPPPPKKGESEGVGATGTEVEPSVDAGSEATGSLIHWTDAVWAILGVSGMVFLVRKVRANRDLKEKLETASKSSSSGKPETTPSPARDSGAGGTVLRLTAKNGLKVFETRLDQTFGRLLLKHSFEEKKFFDDRQFMFTKTSKGWLLVSLKAKNINNLNGLEVPPETRIALKEGDVITLGKSQKCPLRVSFE